MEASPFHRPLCNAICCTPPSQQSMAFAQDSGGALGSAWLCHTWQMATLKPPTPLLPRCWPAMLQHPDFQGHLLATSQHVSHGVSAFRTGEVLSKVRKLQMYSPSFLEVEETWRCT